MTNQFEGLMWYLDKTKEDDDPGSKETEGESPRWRSELRGVDTDQLPLRRFRHLVSLAGDDFDPFGDGVMVTMTILLVVLGSEEESRHRIRLLLKNTSPQELARTGGAKSDWDVKEPGKQSKSVECGTECENHHDWSSVIEDWLKRSAFFGWYSFGKDQQVKRWNHLPAATLAATPSPASQKVVFV